MTLTAELRAFGRSWVKQRRECQCSHDADHQADDKDDNEPRTVVILALAVRFVEGLSLDRFECAIRRHVDCRRRYSWVDLGNNCERQTERLLWFAR